MRVELTPVKIVKEALTVWNEGGSEADLSMDLKNLSFKKESLEAIYSFHVLDHLFSEEAMEALKNWRSLLSPGGRLYIVVDDFELLARSFISGDLDLDEFNDKYSHPIFFRRENLLEFLSKAGFSEEKMKIWYSDVPDLFPKKNYELIFEVTK